MKSLSITAVVASILALTAASGFVHGRLTHRWGPSADLSGAASLLEQTPKHIGRWVAAEEREFTDYERSTLQCAGYLNRVYVHQDTQEQVTVAVLIGPSGPTAVHTPEICMSTRKFVQMGARKPAKIVVGDGTAGDVEHGFWSVIFQETDLHADQTSVWYAWGLGDRWQAVKDPRFEFAGQPYLYKIQVASPKEFVEEDDKLQQEDVCQKFLEDFLPELQRQMKPPAAA